MIRRWVVINFYNDFNIWNYTQAEIKCYTFHFTYPICFHLKQHMIESIISWADGTKLVIFSKEHLSKFQCGAEMWLFLECLPTVSVTVTISVMNAPWPKASSGRKGFFHLHLQGTVYHWGKSGQDPQAGQDPGGGNWCRGHDAEVMEGCCLLAWCPRIAQPAFI